MSPLLPGPPGAPTGPAGPGRPWEPVNPSGPGSPLSPWKIKTVSQFKTNKKKIQSVNVFVSYPLPENTIFAWWAIRSCRTL